MCLIFQILLTPVISSSLSFAGGFELLEQCKESVGTVFASRVTDDCNGSTSILNPATLAKIKDTFLCLSNLEDTQFDFDSSFTERS